MTEALSPDESRGSFKLADVDQQDAARLALILDLVAAKPAVQVLKAWALEVLAPAAGEVALDVGSGTGEEVVELSRRVGSSGRAIGVEPSPGLRAEAVARAAEIEVVDGDALSLPFEDSTFDVVRCERVLQHVSDPVKAAGEMVRVLKPGGRIALIDTDWATAILHPADPVVFARMVDFFLAESANPHSGRKLRGLLTGAGVSILGETAATWIEPQGGATQGFVPMMGATAAAAGVITREEADAFSKGITTAAEQGAFHMSVTMYGVVGAKP